MNMRMLMRCLVVFACLIAFGWLGMACNTDVIEHGKEKVSEQSTPAEQTTEKTKGDAGAPDQLPDQLPDQKDQSCKDDCDCVLKGLGGVCGGNRCDTVITRASNCPFCDAATCPAGQACVARLNGLRRGTCPASGDTCQDDCDCAVSGKGVCEAGKCTTDPKRPNNCPFCDDQTNCTPGSPCVLRKNVTSKSTCPDTSAACQDDCDCVISGKGVCEAGKCTTDPNRANNCPFCDDQTKCTAGAACVARLNGLKRDTCPDTSCQNDCECMAKGQGGVCEGGRCDTVVTRGTTCMECGTPSCQSGSQKWPCIYKDKSIGVCGDKVSCKHDCDCAIKNGWVCDGSQGVCSPLKRPSNCFNCSNSACQTGDPCLLSSGKLGQCIEGKACKDDCDCGGDGFSLVCAGGKCSSLPNKVNTCVACDSCVTKGDRCLNKDGSAGTCANASSFPCGNTTCKVGQEYCDSTIGGAPPSCAQPGQQACDPGCSDLGLACSDGLKRCRCPSYSCQSSKSCKDCSCLEQVLPGFGAACRCEVKNGNLFASCAAP